MLAAMSVEAAADGAVFPAYLAQVLLPGLRRTKPDAVLVMDNLAAHKTPRVRKLLDHSGFAYRYLPGIMEQTDQALQLRGLALSRLLVLDSRVSRRGHPVPTVPLLGVRRVFR